MPLLFSLLVLLLLFGCESTTPTESESLPSESDGAEMQSDITSTPSDIITPSRLEALLKSEPTSLGISTIPAGFEFSLDGSAAKTVSECLSKMTFVNSATPHEPSFAWVISLEYKNSEALTLHYSPNGYIRIEDGEWYKISYKGDKDLGDLLKELCDITDCSHFLDLPDTQKRSVEFGSQYIITNGNFGSEDFPYYVVINSRAELDAYYEDNKDIYDLGRSDVTYRVGFLDACDRYDEAFFENNRLVFVVNPEGSSSIVRYVSDVSSYHDGDGALLGWNITVSSEPADEFTDDIIVIHYVVELKKTASINEGDDVHMNTKHVNDAA